MPKGVFCPNRIVPVQSQLVFPQQYSMREEILNYGDKSVNQMAVSTLNQIKKLLSAMRIFVLLNVLSNTDRSDFK